jgi:hypothetical protein
LAFSCVEGLTKDVNTRQNAPGQWAAVR